MIEKSLLRGVWLRRYGKEPNYTHQAKTPDEIMNWIIVVRRTLLVTAILVVLTGCSAGQPIANWSSDSLTTWQVRQVFTEGLAYESLGDYSRAIERYDVVRKQSVDGHPWPARAQLRMARLHRNHLDNPERSMTLYEEYLDRYPEADNYPNVLLELAGLYQQEGQSDRAASTYRRLIDSFPKTSPVPESYYNLSQIYLDQKRYEAAVNVLDRLLNEYPESTLADGALFRMGQAYGRWDKPEAQLETYRRLLEEHPESDLREYVLYLTVEKAAQQGKIEMARRWADVYREEFPDGEYAGKIQRILEESADAS